MLFKKIFAVFLIEKISQLNNVFGSHFYGGSISSRPIGNSTALITMEFTIRFAYRRNFDASTFCNQTTIHSLTLFAPLANIVCRVGCIFTGETIGTTDEYCSSYSEQNNWSYGHKSFVIAKFLVFMAKIK